MPRKADPRYLAADGSKLCKDCNRVKSVSEFHKAKASTDGYNRICKECAGARSRTWRESNREYALARDRERKREARERNCSDRPPASREKYPAVDGMKRCTACGEVLPVAMFSPKGKTRPGLRPECKACSIERSRETYQKSRERYLASSRRQWNSMDEEDRARYNERQRELRAADPEPSRRNDRKKILKSYGITEEEYDTLLVAQGGTCAICRGPYTGAGNRYHVDHDHQTGAVRGLLCSNCNTAIGRFGDDPERIMDAIRYLWNPPAPALLADMRAGSVAAS